MATATTTKMQTTDLPALLAELRRMRVRAESAVAEIRRAQRECEVRMAERRASDTFSHVAGKNSLKLAEREAERVIATIDRRLAQATSSSDVSTSMADWVRGR